MILSFKGGNMDGVQAAIVDDGIPVAYYSASAHDVMLSRRGSIMSNNQIVMNDKTLYTVIKAQLEKADVEIAAQNWEVANKIIKQAMGELGDHYYCPEIEDDTGLKLIEADIFEKEGKLDNAVRARRRILASRLEMLRSKIK